MDVPTPEYDELKKRRHTGLMLMDLRKAFHTVSHKILLRKLYHYGGRALSLIKVIWYLLAISLCMQIIATHPSKPYQLVFLKDQF